MRRTDRSTAALLPNSFYVAQANRANQAPRKRQTLPDFAEDLAADTFATGLTAGHDALRCGHDGDSESALHTADLIAADVDAAAGARDALEVANDGLVVWAVLQVHAENLHPVLFGGLVIRDVALFLQDAGDLGLQPRCGHVKLLVTGPHGVADTGQEI